MSQLLNKKNQQTIIFSGGGTGGSVTPLLAVAQDLAEQDTDLSYDFLFVGTKQGIEESLVRNCQLRARVFRFESIPAGKFRRYFSWKNFTDIIKIFYAFFVSCHLLRRERPSLIISAGAFVSVPLVWAAYFLKIPIIIHQQDVRPGLANRLMAPLAHLITVTFEKSLLDYGSRAVWIGNPVSRFSHLVSDSSLIRERYRLTNTKKIVLIMGGGTGSVAINNLVFKSYQMLSAHAQVLHLCGAGKLEPLIKDQALASQVDYQVFEFINNEDLIALMSLADVVVTRCGLATLTELCSLSKAAILIPMPQSHQEDNAQIFELNKAAIVLKQSNLSPEIFSEQILKLLHDKDQQIKLKHNISRIMKTDANERLLGFILDILSHKAQSAKK